MLNHHQFEMLPHYSVRDKNIYFLKKMNVSLTLTDSLALQLQQKKTVDINNITIEDMHVFQQLINQGMVIKSKLNLQSANQLNGTCLFLQPHADDCALSCGAHMLAEYLCEKKNIILVTVFSDYCADYFPWQERVTLDNMSYTKLRNSEDLAVCNYLDAEAYFMEIPEAPLRHIAYPILGNNILRKDYKWVDRIYTKLVSLVEQYKPSKIFLPCAIGRHCDHLLLAEVGNRMIHNNIFGRNQIFLYEDYPYCDQTRYKYWSRIHQLKHTFALQPRYIDLIDYLELKAILINFYKSQFIQMPYRKIKKNVKELAMATAIESELIHNKKLSYQYAERVWELI